MLSTAPATIALLEFTGGAVSTSHHKDGRALIRALLRHSDFFALIKEEIPEAQAIWDKEAREQAIWDAMTDQERESNYDGD
jgi:hypothetical protein